MFTKATDIIALHFSDSTLLALRLDSKNQKYAISGISVIALKPGIIEDGRILSVPDLTKAVAQLLAEAKPQAMKPKEVVIGIPESKVFSVALQLPPNLSSSELADSLRRKAAEVVPVEDQLLVADYQKHPVGKQMEYFYAATYLAVMEDFVKVFDSLHIKIRMATLESLALATVLGPKEEKQTALILDIGARNTIATIVTNAYVRESVTITKAGDAWTKSIMESQSISWEEAEKKKQTVGIIASPDNVVAPILLPWFQRWSGEIKLFMTYWQQNHNEQISTIILAGGSAKLPGLVEYTQSALGLPTVIAQAPAGLSLDRVDPAKYITTLGLAMMAGDETLDDINFAEPKLKNIKRSSPKATVVKQQVAKPPVLVKSSESPKPNTKKRTMILLAMLVVVCIVFGLVWWRSLSPTSTVQLPEFADISDDKNIEISFSINTNSATSTPNTDQKVLRGTVETIGLKGDNIQLAAADWQRLKETLALAGGNNTDKNLLYQELIRNQTRDLWQNNIASLTADDTEEPLILLNTYIASSVATSSPSLADIIVDADQLFSLTVNFQVLRVDRLALTTLAQEGWENAYQQPLPTDFQLSNMVISSVPGGVYEVRARVGDANTR